MDSKWFCYTDGEFIQELNVELAKIDPNSPEYMFKREVRNRLQTKMDWIERLQQDGRDREYRLDQLEHRINQFAERHGYNRQGQPCLKILTSKKTTSNSRTSTPSSFGSWRALASS